MGFVTLFFKPCYKPVELKNVQVSLEHLQRQKNKRFKKSPYFRANWPGNKEYNKNK